MRPYTPVIPVTTISSTIMDSIIDVPDEEIFIEKVFRLFLKKSIKKFYKITTVSSFSFLLYKKYFFHTIIEP